MTWNKKNTERSFLSSLSSFTNMKKIYYYNHYMYEITPTTQITTHSIMLRSYLCEMGVVMLFV